MPKRATSTSFGASRGNARGPGNRVGPDVQMFKVRMATIAERTKTAKNLEKILDDHDHPAFMKALEFASDRGFGKVGQSVDVTSAGKQVSGVVLLPSVVEP